MRSSSASTSARAPTRAQLAEREGVDIRTYRVIYQLTEDIQKALVGMLSPVETEETLGEAEVRALFRVSRLGTIAGCMVTSGVVRRGAQVRVVRDGTVIYETSIAQLKRFKDDAREVSEGFECGILLDGFNDVKEGDVLEAYETREVERTDLDQAPSPPRRLQPTTSTGTLRPWRPATSASSPSSSTSPSRLAQGKAEVREVGEGAAARALRRVGRGGRPPRPLAALDAGRRLRDARASASCRSSSTRSSATSARRSGSSCAPSGRWSSLASAERRRKVNEAIRKVLSEALPTLKDPRIGFVTVTGVRTTTDLAQATVFVSVLGSEDEQERTLEGLQSAHGVLQAQVARELGTRRTPS